MISGGEKAVRLPKTVSVISDGKKTAKPAARQREKNAEKDGMTTVPAERLARQAVVRMVQAGGKDVPWAIGKEIAKETGKEIVPVVLSTGMKTVPAEKTVRPEIVTEEPEQAVMPAADPERTGTEQEDPVRAGMAAAIIVRQAAEKAAVIIVHPEIGMAAAITVQADVLPAIVPRPVMQEGTTGMAQEGLPLAPMELCL